MNRQRLTAVAAIAIGSLFAADTFAVPYASGIRNTTGTTYEFILNEAATDVTIQRNVGGAVNLGALGVGRHTFDLGAAASYDIEVSGTSAAGFNLADDTANTFTHYERPGGLAINTIPTSPYFGTVYVNHNRVSSTVSGRTLGNGVYALTADRLGVDLPTFTVPADPNDVTLAKIPGIQFDSTGGSVEESKSMYRINLDDAGNIIASDWSAAKGGIKYITADLTSGGPLLRGEEGPPGGVESDDSDIFGPLPLHGSIVGEVQVSGTLGVDLVVSAMDQNLDVDLAVASADDGNSVWSWNVGSTVGNYAGAPSLVADVGSLTTAGSAIGKDSSGADVFLNSKGGVTANAQYNAQHNKWYLSGARADGSDASSFVILTPEGPGGDGKDIVVDFASRQFGIDNGLDGFTDDPGEDPNNDIFRQTHNVVFSPDGMTMYLQRRSSSSSNPILGGTTGLEGKILVIPLDASGLPIINIDDAGTPGDTSDDFISNLTSIITPEPQGSQTSYSQLKVDAAGNLYYSNNNSEKLYYYSLGGNTVATTSSAGTFEVVTAAPLLGDYNGNGTVDAADYTVYRDTLGLAAPDGNGSGADGNNDGFITELDYPFWADNFGNTSSTSNSSAVPEPTSVLLVVAGLIGLAGRRNRS